MKRFRRQYAQVIHGVHEAGTRNDQVCGQSVKDQGHVRPKVDMEPGGGIIFDSF